MNKKIIFSFIILFFFVMSSSSFLTLGDSFLQQNEQIEINDNILSKDKIDGTIISTNSVDNIIENPIINPASPRTGPQSLAVICVKFHDRATTRWTIGETTDLFDDVNMLYYNISNHLITVNYNVQGWYTMGNDRNLTQFGVTFHWNHIIDSAIQLADADINFASIRYIMVVCNVPNFYCGTSSIGSGYHIHTAEGEFNVGASCVGENPDESYQVVVGRNAHELGHSFGLDHTHYDYRSDYSLMAKAYPADMNVYSLIIDGAAGWFDVSTGQQVFEPGDAGSVVLRPRDIETPAGDIQSIKVVVSSSRFYMVEAVRMRGEDKWRWREGVYIYYVDKNRDDWQECNEIDATPGTLALDDCLWQVGQTYTNTTHSISIQITASDLQPPNAYQITVTNGAAGAPDLHIDEWGSTPGHPPPYETPDIWCDSIVNGWNFYRHRYGTTPIGIGDEPWANHQNRLYARIYNTGATDVIGGTVRFYENIPIGAGQSGTWNLINTAPITISHGDSATVFVLWTPSIPSLPPGSSGLMATHSCVKVEIDPAPGETDTADNLAYENIDYFEAVPGASPIGEDVIINSPDFDSINANFLVKNPFPKTEDIYINAISLNDDWTIDCADIGKFHEMNSLEEKNIAIKFIPGNKVPFGSTADAYLFLSYMRYDLQNGSYEGHLVPFGGLSFSATTMYRSNINLTGHFTNPNVISIEGKIASIDNPPELFPQQGLDRNVLLEIIYPNSTDPIYQVVTANTKGEFSHTFYIEVKGLYNITAYYAGSNILTSCVSEVLTVNTTVTGGFGINSGIQFIIVFSVLTCVILITLKKQKKFN